MKYRSIVGSPRIALLKKKKRKAFKLKMYIYIFLFLIIFLGIAFISRIPGLNIKDINISGNKIIETKKIEDIIKRNLEGNYVFLFPKTNFLIYPKAKIKKDLTENYKRIKSISFDSSNVENLIVEISEYDGKYLWCGNAIPELEENLSDNKCYFLDNDGYIFDESPYFSGDVYFKFYGAVEEGKTIGAYYLPDKFKNIVTFKNNLENMNLKPKNFALYYHETGDEGNFGLGSFLTPYIVFNMDADYEKLAQNLQSALGVDPLKTEIRNDFPSLQYLDLRFGNKVYYKFK